MNTLWLLLGLFVVLALLVAADSYTRHQGKFLEAGSGSARNCCCWYLKDQFGGTYSKGCIKGLTKEDCHTNHPRWTYAWQRSDTCLAEDS